MSNRRLRRMIAMRQDLVRVARERGCPEGFAPPVLYYREHGRFVDKTIIGVIGGYDEHGNALLCWGDAMQKLGLRMWAEHFHADPERVKRDVYRVAVALGRPFRMPPRAKYKRQGRWAPCTVMKHMGVSTWGEVADHLKLRRNYAPGESGERRSA